MKALFLILTAIILGLLAEAKVPEVCTSAKENIKKAAEMLAAEPEKANSEDIWAIGLITDDNEDTRVSDDAQYSELSSNNSDRELVFNYIGFINSPFELRAVTALLPICNIKVSGVKPEEPENEVAVRKSQLN